MFWCVGVGARHEDAPVAASAATAPHFLPIDDEVVSIAFCAGGERPKVTASARLAKQLAPHAVRGEC